MCFCSLKAESAAFSREGHSCWAVYCQAQFHWTRERQLKRLASAKGLVQHLCVTGAQGGQHLM